MSFHAKIQFCNIKACCRNLSFLGGRGNCQEVVRKYIPFTHLNVKKTDKYSFLGVWFFPQCVYMNISGTFAVSCWVRPMVHVAQRSVYCGGTRRWYLGRICCPVFAVHFPHVFQQPWLLDYRCLRLFHLVSIYGRTKPDGIGMLYSLLLQGYRLNFASLLYADFYLYNIPQAEYSVFNAVKMFLNLIIFQCEEI